MPKSKTTQIPRPAPRSGADDEQRSRLGDFTRPISIDKKVSARPAVALGATLVVIAILATLAFVVFVAPLGTWREQDAKLEQLERQYEELSRVNSENQADVDRLRTSDGIREAAREEIGYVDDGERRTTIKDFPALSEALPAGWPYSIVTSMIEVQRTQPLPPTALPADE